MQPKLYNMKKLILSLVILAGFAMKALAYDFQSGDLLYTIISTNPPQVSLDGHLDSAEAQGELTIPETVEYEGVIYTVTVIGENAFNGCMGLTGHLEIPPTIKRIGKHAFRQCSGFIGDLVIPNSVDTISYGAFRECSGFDGNLRMSESMTRIEMYTFSGCSGFTGTLNIPESVTEIDADAFSYCRGFSGTLIIPDAVREIGVNSLIESHGAFQECTRITNIVLPDTENVIIGPYCFAGTGITGKLVFPSGITEIWSSAFASCHRLSKIELNEGLEYIGQMAFIHCDALEDSLVIPESVKEIDNRAFEDCSRLSTICFRNAPERLGNGAFCYCTNLSYASLPEDLEKTGPFIFQGCTNLSYVELPSSLTTIDKGCFESCQALTKIAFPKNLKVIGAMAFSRSGLVGEIILPHSIETIEVMAFCETNITEVILGESVKELWETAFCRIPNLNTVVVKSRNPATFHQYVGELYQMQRDLPIIVPCGTQETYQNTPGWNIFSNIQDGMTILFSAVSSDETAGTVYLLKEATCEDRTVEVLAESNEGWKFLYWEANGEQVSSENPYSFVLEEDTELVAYFSGAGVDETEQSFVVYPNPTNGLVTITGQDLQSAGVFNTLGQQVAAAAVSGEQITIDFKDLPVGLYFVNITKKDGRKCVRKIVKE